MTGLIRQHVAPYAYAVLPSGMESGDATSMLLAIGWQESRFSHRVQVKGPAKGFWQFEQPTVRLLLAHQLTSDHLQAAWTALGYRQAITPFGVYAAIEHNDALAFVVARLLLWTVPAALPSREGMQEGWRQYAGTWRPGKPHVESWPDAWTAGWNA